MIVKVNNMDYKKIQEYAKELKKLLNTDYVGYESTTQLKMGVTTLELLVNTLKEKSNGKA
jgi:hypothetical protein